MLEEITKKGRNRTGIWKKYFLRYRIFEEKKEKNDREYWLTVKLASDCSMKGVRAYLVISRLQDSGIEVVNTVPSLSDLEGENFGQSLIFWFVLLFLQRVAKIVGSVAEIERVEVKRERREEKNQ